MSKKRKSKAVYNFQKPPHKPKDWSDAIPPPWWRQPVCSADRYSSWGSVFGYSLTVLLFLSITAYLLKGYSVRPRILSTDIVSRLLHPPTEELVEIYQIGPQDSVTNAQSQDGSEGILLKFGPDKSTGFIVSRNLLNLPDDAVNLGVSIHGAYQGTPTMNYGFTNSKPKGPIENWTDFLSDSSAISTELPPSPVRMQFFISMAANYYDREDFNIEWKEAKYFFFVFTSLMPTEFFLNKLTFLEKR